MDKIIRDEWVLNLLSGEYEQGESQLLMDNKFCCLGVLCDMYVKAHKDVEWIDTIDPETGFKVSALNIDPTILHYIPKKVAVWSGIECDPISKLRGAPFENPIGYDLELGPEKSLALLNDMGAPFKFIAEKIQENL